MKIKLQSPLTYKGIECDSVFFQDKKDETKAFLQFLDAGGDFLWDSRTMNPPVLNLSQLSELFDLFQDEPYCLEILSTFIPNTLTNEGFSPRQSACIIGKAKENADEFSDSYVFCEILGLVGFYQEMAKE